jgi:cytochrome c biogenesis protein CcmG/thiol:disulfide interchange protein DsbE
MSDSRPRQFRFAFIALAATTAAIAAGWAIGQYRAAGIEEKPTGTPTRASSFRGELLFQQHCTSCHGAEGRGDGASAAAIKPPPRDLAARPWRFEVSPESIRRVIREGIAGTPMASFKLVLNGADLEAVVEHTHRLATSRPPIPYEPTEDERLLKNADFTDLRGAEVPSLTVSDASGKETTLSNLKGRLVLLHFWGQACPHCLSEMPRLRDLERDLSKDGLLILYVCTDAEHVKEAQVLAERVAPGIRVHAEERGLGLARFEVQSLPTYWLIGPNGKAIGRAQGARNWRNPALLRLVEHWLPLRG